MSNTQRGTPTVSKPTKPRPESIKNINAPNAKTSYSAQTPNCGSGRRRGWTAGVCGRGGRKRLTVQWCESAVRGPLAASDWRLYAANVTAHQLAPLSHVARRATNRRRLLLKGAWLRFSTPSPPRGFRAPDAGYGDPFDMSGIDSFFWFSWFFWGFVVLVFGFWVVRGVGRAFCATAAVWSRADTNDVFNLYADLRDALFVARGGACGKCLDVELNFFFTFSNLWSFEIVTTPIVDHFGFCFC